MHDKIVTDRCSDDRNRIFLSNSTIYCCLFLKISVEKNINYIICDTVKILLFSCSLDIFVRYCIYRLFAHVHRTRV